MLFRSDHIVPAGGNVLPFRSNIEKISEFTFYQIDGDFYNRCKENNGGLIIAGENYGQGSSREHAAMAPLYLGIKAVIAKSFARIHKQNLINQGVIPFTFTNPDDYNSIDLMDELEILDVVNIKVSKNLTVINKTKNIQFEISHDLSEDDIETVKIGGLLNKIKLMNKSK